MNDTQIIPEYHFDTRSSLRQFSQQICLYIAYESIYFLKHPSHFWAYMLEPNREIWGFFKGEKKNPKIGDNNNNNKSSHFERNSPTG